MAQNSTQQKNILLVGLVCEDICITVPEFPKEDSKIRLSSSVLRRGGNAGNSSVVLSILLNKSKHIDHNIYFMAPLSNRQRSQFVVNDLNKYGINTDLCIYSKDHDMTVSYIIISNETKSRTIINNPCLKGLSFDDFIQSVENCKNKAKSENNLLNSIDSALQFVENKEKSQNLLNEIGIIHFEARWITSTIRMLGHIKKEHPNMFISVEIEKERLYNNDDGRSVLAQNDFPVNDLIPFADLLFFSSQLVKGRGYVKEDNPKQFIKDLVKEYGAKKDHPLTIVVPWGDKGAYGLRYDCSLHLYDEKHLHDIEDEIVFAEACPPKNGVMDTIGAGDTFIAAYLHYASTRGIFSYDVEKALAFGCKVAGHKVGHVGFDCVKNLSID